MLFENFKHGSHGGHLGYQDETISAILNLHVAPIPSTKLRLNPTYRSGAAVAAILEIITKWFKQFWISMSSQCLPPINF